MVEGARHRALRPAESPLRQVCGLPPPRAGEDRFAASAARLAGLAGALLGWRPEEFWAATPEELGGILAAIRPDGGAGLTARDLANLKEMFPDG